MVSLPSRQGLSQRILYIPVLVGLVLIGVVAYHAHGLSPTVTVEDLGAFVILNSFAGNNSLPAQQGIVMNQLIAGQWGYQYRLTVLDSAWHIVNFRLTQSYGLANATLTVDENFTLKGTVTVYLGLGTNAVATPYFIDCRWT